MSRIIINNWLAWGNLLKSWATGRPDPVAGISAPPKTLDELKIQLVKTGAGSIPGWVVDFELVAWQEEKLRIQLPSRQIILNIEALLKAGRPYPLPSFYHHASREGHELDARSMGLALHAMRIGELAVSDF